MKTNFFILKENLRLSCKQYCSVASLLGRPEFGGDSSKGERREREMNDFDY